MNKKRRIMLGIAATALVIAIGIGAKIQNFAEPMAIILPIILAGEVLAVGAYFFLKKRGYSDLDAFSAAAAIAIFSPMTGLVFGLLETGNLGRGIFHIAELSFLIIIPVVYLISGMEQKKNN